MVSRTIVGILVGALMSPLPHAAAQHVPESILRLKPGTSLRAETLSLGTIDGRLVRATSDTLFLIDGSEMVLAIRDLQVLWQRGRATKAGAIVGGLVGPLD